MGKEREREEMFVTRARDNTCFVAFCNAVGAQDELIFDGHSCVIDDEGNFLGSVSGGCVEGAVVTEALDVIESGKPKTLEFGVADETAWKVGLSCGGTIRVFVEKVD